MAAVRGDVEVAVTDFDTKVAVVVRDDLARLVDGAGQAGALRLKWAMPEGRAAASKLASPRKVRAPWNHGAG